MLFEALSRDERLMKPDERIRAMKNIVSTAAAGVVALALGACGDTELQKAQQTQAQPTSGTPFTQSLNKYYVQAAQSQWVGQADFAGSEHLAKKAQAAAAGQPPLPDSVEEQGRAVKKNGELTEQRARLMTAIDKEAPAKAPDDTARAQVAYDCWLEEASDPTMAVESKWLEHKVRNCRTDFYTAMASVDHALTPAQVHPGKFVIYFHNDSAFVTQEGMKTLIEAAQTAREDHIIRVTIIGNADRTGSKQYNQKLSEMRAQEVRDILMKNGVGQDAIIAEGRGEDDPQVATADGVAEQQNRNAIITFEHQ